MNHYAAFIINFRAKFRILKNDQSLQHDMDSSEEGGSRGKLMVSGQY